MANRNPGGGTGPLFLEDLRVGQRFVSGTHRIDAEQIRAFAEQFDPQRLLDLAALAETVGFDSVWVSDHYQPFRHTDGHAPFSLSWLGAAKAFQPHQSVRLREGKRAKQHSVDETEDRDIRSDSKRERGDDSDREPWLSAQAA